MIEADEFFCEPEPVSALRWVDDIDRTNLFVCGAATEGAQVPGMRIGRVAAATAGRWVPWFSFGPLTRTRASRTSTSWRAASEALRGAGRRRFGQTHPGR